jgi:hypothetical protein
VVAGAYVIAARVVEKEWRWQPLAYTAGGVVLGLIINPYFPNNIKFIYDHYVAKLDVNSISVGMEWYPYTTEQLLKNSPVALAAIAVGAFAWGWIKERMTLASLFLFGLTLFFGIMVFISKRFIEYFPPFPVLFAAVTLKPVLSEIKPPWFYRVGGAVLLIGLLAYTVNYAHDDFGNTDSPALFTGSGQWLTKNTPENAVVFQTDWDDFGRLFHYDSHNVFIVGLDPTYLSLADKKLYDEWVDLTQGRGEDDWAAQIKRDFGACYVVSDLNHTNFTNRADKDPKFHQVYKDDNSVVYQFCTVK